MAITLGIICGGRSGEHEVSLRSARGIYGAVDRARFDPLLIAIDKQGQWRGGSLERLVLDGDNPARIRLNPAVPPLIPVARDGRLFLLDYAEFEPVHEVAVCFPIIHGTDGEDGALQGWLRINGLPFVGADVLGSAIGMDKDVMKRLLLQAGLPVARFHTLLRGADFQAAFERAQSDLKLPVFVKPASLGSSVGVSKVMDRRGFESALEEAFCYDDKLLVEEAVTGREIECSVLGNRHSTGFPPRASRTGEVVPRHAFYSYVAKYLDENGAELRVPAPIDAATELRIQGLALRVFDVLECDGLARVDFFLRPDGGIFINEINTLPGFTPISMYPKLWEISGLSYGELVSRLVDLALERHQRRQALQRSFRPV
jgi:D-alanine-D-alanine ligase